MTSPVPPRSPNAIEVSPPDLRAYQSGNCGIDYLYHYVSGRSGPHVMINALSHGNEISGAIAVKDLLDQNVRPQLGSLTLCFANIAAYQLFSPLMPERSRCIDEDFNRLWQSETLDSSHRTVERARARQLRPVIDTVDYLLDLHSMQAGATPLILTGQSKRSIALALHIGLEGLIVSDAGHKNGKRLCDYARFTAPNSPAASLLLEAGSHWRRATAEFATRAARQFLEKLGLIVNNELAFSQNQPAQRRIEVTDAITVESDQFAFVQPFVGLEQIPRAGTIIAYQDQTPIRTPYDDCILIMPAQRLGRGQTAVRLGRFADCA